MTPPKETVVSKAIVAYLRGLPQGHARKVHGGAYSGTVGEPDVDAVVRGRPVKLEVKRPGSRTALTRLQRQALDRWEHAGALVGVVVSVDETRALLWTNMLVDDDLDRDEQHALVRTIRSRRDEERPSRPARTSR